MFSGAKYQEGDEAEATGTGEQSLSEKPSPMWRKLQCQVVVI